MMYIFMLITASLLFILNYQIFRKDIFHPGVLIPAIFFIQALFGLSLYDYWKLFNYSGQTVLIFLSGLISFEAGGLIAFRTRFIISKKQFEFEKNAGGGIIKESIFHHYSLYYLFYLV